MAGLLPEKSILETKGGGGSIDFTKLYLQKPVDFSKVKVNPVKRDPITLLTDSIPAAFEKITPTIKPTMSGFKTTTPQRASYEESTFGLLEKAGILSENIFGAPAFFASGGNPFTGKPLLRGGGSIPRGFMDQVTEATKPILGKFSPVAGLLAGIAEPLGPLGKVPKIPKALESVAETAKKFRSVEEFTNFAKADPAVMSLLQSNKLEPVNFYKLATAKAKQKIASGEQKSQISQEQIPELPPPTARPLPKLPPSTSSYASDLKNLANEKLNVDRFNVSPESKDIIERVIEEVKPQIQQKIGTVLSNREAIDLASRSSKILTRAVGREETLEWQAANLRSRQALAAASKDGKVDESYVKNLVAIKTRGTDIARKLQSLNTPVDEKDLTGKQAIIEAILKTNAKIDDIIEKAKGVDFTNLKQATNFYRQFVKPTATEWLDLIRYNSMLSSPKTHIINAFSNLLNTTMVVPIEKALTGGLDFLGSKITGRGRSAFVGEGGAYAKNYFKKVGEATMKFADVMRGKRAYTNLDTRSIPISASGAKGAVVTALSYPSRVLEATDQFFMTLAQGAEAGALRYRASKGVDVGNIETAAERGAKYRVFRRELFDEEQGPLLDALDQFTNLVMMLRNNKNPLVSNLAKFTAPFVQTPMNILKQGAEYSPFGFGTIPGAKNKTEQLSKAIIGSSVMAGAYMMLASNRLTFGEPIEASQKQAFRAAGMQAYSVKIGDKWYSYQKLPPPLAFPLALLAGIHETKENKQIDDNTIDLVLTAFANSMEFFADQSYAKSFGDLLAAAKGGEAAIEKLISNYGQQLVPYRALGGWLARIFDTTQRKVDSSQSFINQQMQLLMMNIPGLSQKVQPRVDAQGNPIPNQSRIGNAFSPIMFSRERNGGSAEFQKLLEIRKANKITTANSAELKENAEAEFNKINTLSDPDEKEAYLKEIAKSDPKVAKKVITLLKEEAKGLSTVEKKLADAPIATRARYIVSELNALSTPEEKKALLKKYAQKKIVTEDTLREIVKLLKQ